MSSTCWLLLVLRPLFLLSVYITVSPSLAFFSVGPGNSRLTFYHLSKSLHKESSFTPVVGVKGIGLPLTGPSWGTSPFGGYADWLILGCVSMSGVSSTS